MSACDKRMGERLCVRLGDLKVGFVKVVCNSFGEMLCNRFGEDLLSR